MHLTCQVFFFRQDGYIKFDFLCFFFNSELNMIEESSYEMFDYHIFVLF